MTVNMKFRVNNQEHSKQIQEALFSLGYAWCVRNPKDVRNTEAEFLFADKDDTGSRVITWCDDEDFFNDNENIECVLFGSGILTLAAYNSLNIKPQFDLRPRSIASSERMVEVLEAMKRYAADGKKLPEEWLRELDDLNLHLS